MHVPKRMKRDKEGRRSSDDQKKKENGEEEM